MSKALSFILAHQFAIASTLAACVVLGRAIKARFGAQIAAKFPRVAHLAAAVAAISPDLVAFCRALAHAWLGTRIPAQALGAANMLTMVLNIDATQAHAELDALAAKAQKVGAVVNVAGGAK